MGKTVYLPSLGDQNEYYLYLYLKENGIALNKVHIGVLSGDAVTEADAGFRGKRIDAALEAPPVAQTEVKDGISVPLFTSEQVDPNAELAVWQANAAFVRLTRLRSSGSSRPWARPTSTTTLPSVQARRAASTRRLPRGRELP